MKVLWLVNTLLPAVAAEFNLSITPYGGWIIGALNSLNLKEAGMKLAVCSVSYEIAGIKECELNGVCYFVVPMANSNSFTNCSKLKKCFADILKEFNPDLIHIFGTEYRQSAVMAEVAPKEKTIISIQGIATICSQHYMAGLPVKYHKDTILKKWLQPFIGNFITQEKNGFIERARGEKILLKAAKYVIGRTTWDRACISQISKDIKYFSCNETLRDTFYHKEWSLAHCQRHTLFCSQSGYPLKGFHKLLEAMPLIIKEFPDAHIYVTGDNIVKNRGLFKEKLFGLFFEYNGYLNELIKKYDLYDHISFCGMLNEQQMVERYLAAHVFVLPSSIENSPNSLGEAMLLGVPCVASCVGGVQDLLQDKQSGFIYPFDEPYMLAYYVCEIFSDDELAKSLSGNAKKQAAKIHDRKKNSYRLVEIYNEILGVNDGCY